jgi:pyruvate,water dikinase
VAVVGGKNSSLGEMLCQLSLAGIKVPNGFATTAAAYWSFLEANGLREVLAGRLRSLSADRRNLAEVGSAMRKLIMDAELPVPLAEAVTAAHADLMRGSGRKDGSVAVRSSATAEDLPEASFAGQLETFLNVRGRAALLTAVKRSNDCDLSIAGQRQADRHSHWYLRTGTERPPRVRALPRQPWNRLDLSHA